MTAVLVLQSVVMLAQIGLGIYGIVQVLQVQRADDGYLCGESINVFWTLLGLHFIQNTCVVGKLSKGCRGVHLSVSVSVQRHESKLGQLALNLFRTRMPSRP